MTHKKIIYILFGLFVLTVVAYTLYSVRFMVYGPQIDLNLQGSPITAHSQIIEIAGVAKHSTELKLNNRIVMLSPEGAFNERMLLTPGKNEFVLQATDRFGHQNSKTFIVFYKPQKADILKVKK